MRRTSPTGVSGGRLINSRQWATQWARRLGPRPRREPPLRRLLGPAGRMRVGWGVALDRLRLAWRVDWRFL